MSTLSVVLFVLGVIGFQFLFFRWSFMIGARHGSEMTVRALEEQATKQLLSLIEKGAGGFDGFEDGPVSGSDSGSKTGGNC